MWTVDYILFTLIFVLELHRPWRATNNYILKRQIGIDGAQIKTTKEVSRVNIIHVFLILCNFFPFACCYNFPLLPLYLSVLFQLLSTTQKLKPNNRLGIQHTVKVTVKTKTRTVLNKSERRQMMRMKEDRQRKKDSRITTLIPVYYYVIIGYFFILFACRVLTCLFV